jgi:DNA polymerase III delta prime subunit
MNSVKDQFLWTEKYRPQKIKDCILTPSLKKTFQDMVDKKQVGNLLLIGPAGTGKTTVARAMLTELEADNMLINASLANKDTLRTDITNYASSVAFFGGRKYIILDEADGLDKEHFQKPLRAAMEKYAKNCGFILTANFEKKLIEPIHSRCTVIDFAISKKDAAKLAGEFFKRVCKILDGESITYDKAVVAKVIEVYFPDWRRVLNELQRYSTNGTIDSGILSELGAMNVKELVGFMKAKKFTEVRKWVAENLDADPARLFRGFYDNISEFFKPSFIPPFILILNQYQVQASQVADPEINVAAFLSEVMAEAEWK